MTAVRLTLAEAIIGELLDEGLSVEAIVRARPDIDAATVRRLGGYLRLGKSDLWPREARAAIAALAAAIAHFHPEQVGSAA
jgi:hypothetical protein